MKRRDLPLSRPSSFPLLAALLLAILLIVLLVYLAEQAWGQTGSRGIAVPQVRQGMLVSTEWLARHMKDPGIVLLHIGRDRKDYDAGHIPGARFLALNQIVTARGGVPNELPPVADLKKAFESVGVGDNSRVVLYGEMQGLLAARAFFTLDYLGHGERAALLDGGLEKWRADRREISTAAPGFEPATFTPRVNPDIIVFFPQTRDLSWEAVHEPQSKVRLVDARPMEEYAGEKPSEGLSRPGHIPGAVSLFWMKLVESKEDPEVLPPHDLRKAFESAGIRSDQRIIIYCRTGVQASFAYFALKYAGYQPQMYDGSFMEWSKQPDTEVATVK